MMLHLRVLCSAENAATRSNSRVFFRSLIISIALSLCVVACDDRGADDGGSSRCGADVKGRVFGLDEGTATLKGTVTLPQDTPAGLMINLMVMEGSSQARRGVIPDFNFDFGASNSCLDNLRTRGEQFTYEIENLETGEYRLHLKLLEGEGEMTQEVYDQSSQLSITVGDGEIITHDETFISAD